MRQKLFVLAAALTCAGSAACGKGPEPEKPQTPQNQAAPAARTPSGNASAAGIKWVTIPGGSFMMGAEDWTDTKLLHRVTVKTFQLAKTLVTNKQYQACVEAGACTAAHASDGTCDILDGTSWSPGNMPDSFRGGDRPVVCVDWEQAKAFSQWAGGRLPSEAEWEYAARGAGKDYKYPWGDEDATCARAVTNEGGMGCGRDATWPVCSKPKGNSAQGLCDMAGNVWEWLQDWYHDSYDGAPTDGSAWESPPGSARVFRGGSWGRPAGLARSARRDSREPESHSTGLGFRPARD